MRPTPQASPLEARRRARDRLVEADRRYADALERGGGGISRALRALQRAEAEHHAIMLRAHAEQRDERAGP